MESLFPKGNVTLPWALCHLSMMFTMSMTTVLDAAVCGVTWKRHKRSKRPMAAGEQEIAQSQKWRASSVRMSEIERYVRFPVPNFTTTLLQMSTAQMPFENEKKIVFWYDRDAMRVCYQENNTSMEVWGKKRTIRSLWFLFRHVTIAYLQVESFNSLPIWKPLIT